jgi:2-beta-glucuronyltransferase
MNLFQWTAQPFLPATRRVSTHFIAEEWARAEHNVHVATVGLSSLSKLKDQQLYEALAKNQKNRFLEVEPRLNVSAYIPLVHPFSSQNKLLNALNRPVFKLYGGYIPNYLRSPLASADAVFFEPGTCLCFFKAARRVNPRAVFVYFKRDWLKTIGAGPFLQEIETEILPNFDLVITPSSVIADKTAKFCRTVILPQAIDKSVLDNPCVSPYETGSKNAISIGNMLFDEEAFNNMAAADRSVTYHVFGARFSRQVPSNVNDYGEKPFQDLVPYLKFADFGVAGYKMRKEDVYLAETSLKFLQYAYCRLPVLTPDLIPDARGNLVGYSVEGEKDWPGKIASALSLTKNPKFGDGILDWNEVASQIVESVRNS